MNGRLPPLTRPSAAQDLVHAIPMVGFGACGALTFGTQETIGSPLLNGGIPYIHHMRGVFGHVLSKPFTSKIVIWRWGGGGRRYNAITILENVCVQAKGFRWIVRKQNLV